MHQTNQSTRLPSHLIAFGIRITPKGAAQFEPLLALGSFLSFLCTLGFLFPLLLSDHAGLLKLAFKFLARCVVSPVSFVLHTHAADAYPDP